MSNSEEKVILTPKPSPKPRINSAAVFGVRPGSPFLYTIAATGERPMEFSAEGLPEGLSLDGKTGQITGKITKAGDYKVVLSAKNALGVAQKTLKICVGDKIALTPPMGWNDWNCWAVSIDQEKVWKAAKAFIDKGLADHGWTYINIDDAWQGDRSGEFGGLQGNEKFPDIKGLADKVHSMGLKLGIYSTPWAISYAGYPGGSSLTPADGKEIPENKRYLGEESFAENDAKQWAAWTIDYLKYDWHPNDPEHIGEMETALRDTDRDIVYSLSNSAPFEIADYLKDHANCWRTTGDIRDNWESMSSIGFSQAKWTPFGGPGHWNDPDMLVVGYVGWGPNLHPSDLTPDEQYTHISLWCLRSAPLLIGCDLDRLDDFTLNLLTNDEVLELDQDPLGDQAVPVFMDGDFQVWAKNMEDGTKAVGLFNLGDSKGTVKIDWDKLGISGSQIVRDLWRQKDLGDYKDAFDAKVASHGVILVRIRPSK